MLLAYQGEVAADGAAANSFDPAGGRAAHAGPLAMEHAVLHLLEENRGPAGSGTLMERLQNLGFAGSEPTVGRFLHELDRRGVTERISNKGRGLTEAGHERLQQICEADAQRNRERELLRTLRPATIDDILDVLVARRALERETARLTAVHATNEEIVQIEAAVREQQEAMAVQGTGADADVRVHSLIAQASHNRVLAAALELIRSDSQLRLMVDAILQESDHEWFAGHERILEAIKRRAPAQAETAVLAHIDTVIAEVRRYRAGLASGPIQNTGAARLHREAAGDHRTAG